jgi:hypothetical protein
LTSDRVWRVRKRHRCIDAEIHSDAPGSTSFATTVLRDGSRLIYERRWPTREEAEADARAKLAELERAGWITHW